MSVCRVVKTRDFTIMSNHHLKNKNLSLKAKGLLSYMLSLPEDWNYTIGGLTVVCMEGRDAIREAVKELERQGYRFNLYAVQTYTDSNDADMLVVKVKDASKPLDLKRISFPLTHTAFFRVIGFDWYSKVPGGRYRGAYGCALAYTFEKDKIPGICKQLFGNNSVYLSATQILKMDKDHVKEVLGNGNSKN